MTPATLRPVADPLAAAVEAYRAVLLDAAPADARDEVRERIAVALEHLRDAAHAAGLPRRSQVTL